jgi:hypothetical protein
MPSLPLNPMGINGPNSSGNYQQPNTAAPTVNVNVASYPVGANMLGLTWPIPKHVSNDNTGKFYPQAPVVVYPQKLNALQVSNNPAHP